MRKEKACDIILILLPIIRPTIVSVANRTQTHIGFDGSDGWTIRDDIIEVWPRNRDASTTRNQHVYTGLLLSTMFWTEWTTGS